MAKWNTSDKIAVFGTAVAIVLGVAALPFGHTGVPDDAIVIHELSHTDPGVRIQQTRFRNVSYGIPLKDFEAEWNFNCESLTSYSVDGSAPGAHLRCDTQKSAATLSLAGGFPPLAWTGTTF